MQWKRISPQTVKRRVADAAVMLFLGLVFVLTGCDIPGRSDREATRDRGVAETPAVPARPVANVGYEVYEAAPAEPTPRALPDRVTYDEAESLFRERRYADAVDYFRIYLNDRPENVWGWYMLALSAREAGQLDEAVDAFERGLDLDPTHVKSLLNLTRVLLRLDRPDDALARIEEALSLDPASVDGFRLLGLVRHELGRVEEAEDAFYQALVLDETDVWSMNNLGFVRIQQGAFESALPPLARAVEVAPNVAVFQNNLGIALERVGYHAAAVEAYRAALAADSTHGRARRSLERVGDRPDADALPPLDLVGLADAFVSEVRGDESTTSPAVPDTISVEVRDTTPEAREVRPDTLPPAVPDSLGTDQVGRRSFRQGVPPDGNR